MEVVRSAAMEHSFGPDGSDSALQGVRRQPLFIVGVDGTDSGLAALRAAAGRAAEADARLLCVHVRALPGMWEMTAFIAPGAVAISRECRDRREVDAWLQCVQTLDPTGRPWRFTVVSGRPDRSLAKVAAAEHGDALFVGQLPRGAWSRWFHRCPARRLARSGVCPVHRTTAD
jgi:nucleotide-binding universal stress UspA family protein